MRGTGSTTSSSGYEPPLRGQICSRFTRPTYTYILAGMLVCRLASRFSPRLLASPSVLCLQLLLCLLLFSVALFLTTVVAKVLASYFHKQTFFDQMAETLRNVRACLTPHIAVSACHRPGTSACQTDVVYFDRYHRCTLIVPCIVCDDCSLTPRGTGLCRSSTFGRCQGPARACPAWQTLTQPASRAPARRLTASRLPRWLPGKPQGRLQISSLQAVVLQSQ